MFYSNSRAGLVALLVFALVISFVSAVPIPTTESGLSPTLNGLDHHIQLDNAKISLSTAFSAAPRDASTGMDDLLVRRSSVGSKIKKAFQKVGSAIKHVAQKVGSGIKAAAQKVGSGIKAAAQKVGSGIKKVAQKVGSGVRTAANKVGKFMKTTGAKVAKFGLKVVESVGTLVGKVAGYIPAIGKPIDRAIEGVSKVAGVVSDHIHAKLSSKLQKGMNVMNKADTVMGYIPRRREFLSEEEAFLQRDFIEPYYYLEERDDLDFALENRDESYFEAAAVERDLYERYDLDWE